jgi:predicted RecA/RadA family phage recombinase
MATNYVQDGSVLNYTNGTGSDISSGDVVVLGETGDAVIGVALVDIADTESGAVALEGVFTLAKVSAAVFKQGESLIWDSSASAFDDNQATPASGDVSGSVVAAADGANTETTCTVRLTGRAGTLTA